MLVLTAHFFPAAIEGLSVYEGASGSGATGTLMLGPVDGDLSGTVITASAPESLFNLHFKQ